MTSAEQLLAACGDLARFGDAEDRVQMLVDQQLRERRGFDPSWLVLPIGRQQHEFCLVSPENEGQRRGREVLTGFLGPSVVTFETMQMEPNAPLMAAGMSHSTLLQRLGVAPMEFLSRLEDALATVHGRADRTVPERVTHLDLLRDLRLSLLRGDGQQVDRLLEELGRSGRLSGENLRFLRVHALGGLARWHELSALPHLPDLLRARRPREVTEMLLRMIWWTELAPRLAAGDTATTAAQAQDLTGRFGAILHTIDVPSDVASRAVALVAAKASEDKARIARLRGAASDQAEEALQQRLLGLQSQNVPDSASGGARALFEQGQYVAVVEHFLAQPLAIEAVVAVEAVLETQDLDGAARVLDLVQEMTQDGALPTTRRLARDLEELRALVLDACSTWVEWGERVRRSDPWPHGDRVAREGHTTWPAPEAMSHADVEALADGILAGWSGANQAHLAACLDLLCSAAARTAAAGQTVLAEAVLLILSEQSSLTGVVREAYLDLFEQSLYGAPGGGAYGQLLEHGVSLWKRVESPSAFDWGLALLDLTLDAPCPDEAARVQAAAQVLARWPEWSGRLSLRQFVDAGAIAAAVGLPAPPMPPAAVDDQLDIWRRLDAKLVGLYSLLPRAASDLAVRLGRLNGSARLEGNADNVATDALRGLAGRADYLIVDTWHAAHAATGAIDRVRPRDRQILPRGRGLTGFLRALEDVLMTS